jgi:hypothetical protein
MLADSKVTQIMVRRLRPDADRRHYLSLSRRMLAWLSHQPGFLGYRRYEHEAGWIDQVDWASADAAQSAAQAFCETEIWPAMAAISDRARDRIIAH